MSKTTEHDIFEGEIPKKIGKQSPPIWLRAIFLVGLVAILGAATLKLKDSHNNHIEPGLDLTQALSELDNQISIDETILLENEPESTDLSIDVFLDSPQNVSDIENVENNASIDILPATNEVAPTEKNDLDLLNEVSHLSSRLSELETTQSERNDSVKSSIELHSHSLDELNKLVRSLEDLKKELSSLKLAPLASPPAPTAAPTPKSSLTVERTTASTPTPKDLSVVELSLLGIDTWGGERFAQIEYEGQIHLLSINEHIGSWRVENIAHDRVVVRDKKGELIEITN